MKLTVFGATGGIGRQICAQATDAGHDVTAVVRNPAAAPAAHRTITADLAVADPATLASAIGGADAVLSGLGPRTRAEIGIVAHATRVIATAMSAAGVRRLIVISAAPIGTVASPDRPHPPRHDPGDGVLMRSLLSPLTKALLRAPYADLALMEDVLRESGLDWTVIRPPRLTNSPRTGTYRTALGCNLLRGLTVSRGDVADLALRLLDRPETIGTSVGIAR